MKIAALLISISLTSVWAAQAAQRIKRAAYDLPDALYLLQEPLRPTFVCEKDGYYADQDNNCQIFHVCHTVTYHYGRTEMLQYSFICGNLTIFNQNSFTCTYPKDAVPCDRAHEYFHLNDQLGDPNAAFQGGQGGAGQRGGAGGQGVAGQRGGVGGQGGAGQRGFVGGQGGQGTPGQRFGVGGQGGQGIPGQRGGVGGQGGLGTPGQRGGVGGQGGQGTPGQRGGVGNQGRQNVSGQRGGVTMQVGRGALGQRGGVDGGRYDISGRSGGGGGGGSNGLSNAEKQKEDLEKSKILNELFRKFNNLVEEGKMLDDEYAEIDRRNSGNKK